MASPEDHGQGAIFDALDIGLIVLDADGRIVDWNAWLAQTSHITFERAKGKLLEELLPIASSDRLTSAISDALKSGVSSLLTHVLHPRLLPLKTRAGRPLIHNVSVQPVGDQLGSGCLVQITDITVTTQREQLLRRRQNARYDAVVDSAPDGIVTLDADGLIQLANPAAGRELGYVAQDLLGQPLAAFLLQPEVWREAWQQLIKGDGVIPPTEVEGRRKDGSKTYMEMSASSWTSDFRIFVTVIMHDVNARREAEIALRNMNQTLEMRVAERTADRDRMWRLSSDVMTIAQLDGTITAVNPAWTRLFDWQEGELIGVNLAALVLPDDQPRLLTVLGDLTKGPLATTFELRLQQRDKGVRVVEWSAVAADGLLHAVGRDVTAERDAERALKEAEETLRHSQKMEAIGQLTGGIAHDFNNLLTGIIGAMDILKRRFAAGRYEDTERFMDAAVASANRAAALTHRLLAFARRQPLDPKPIAPNRLVVEMEDLFHRTLGEQVTITTELADDLWLTLADEHGLENAILNLAVNARDAMPAGGRLTIVTANTTIEEVQTYGQEAVEPGEYVVITVRDTGAGMAADVLSKAFEPFFSTKPIGQGTGLGLSMIYGFVRQSRGHVHIESALGKGTSVFLYLPRYRGQLARNDAALPSEQPEGTGETVLLIEDDTSVQLLIAEVLRELGYACITANDGQDALPIITSSIRLDLMITDVGLPGLSGRQLADIARRHRPDLKILLVTGYAEEAIGNADFLAAGMEMFTKPFAIDALASKIRKIIGA